jgi:hypothetical protein
MLQGMTTYSTRSDWLCSFTINEFTLSFLTKFSKKVSLVPSSLICLKTAREINLDALHSNFIFMKNSPALYELRTNGPAAT